MAASDDDGKFRIFISHKVVEHDLASKTREVLMGLSRDISCFVSGVDIPAGADWNRLIKSALVESNLLLLLFSNPDHHWDWCLYEAGLFTQFDVDKPKAVVTIYNPKAAPPGPLENLQGVPAERKKVGRFLKRLCKSTQKVSDNWNAPPLNVDVTEEQLKRAAGDICKGFRHATTHHPCHRVVLDLRDSKRIGETIPENARVMTGKHETGEFTLFLFGLSLGKENITWGDLVERVGGSGATWRRELDKAFSASMEGHLFSPGGAALATWDGKKRYKPILYRVQKAEQLEVDSSKTSEQSEDQVDKRRCRIVPLQITIVLEQIYPPVKDDILGLVCLGHQYETKVFARFCDDDKKLDKTPSERFTEIWNAIHSIEIDSTRHRLLDGVAALQSSLDEVKDKPKITNLTKLAKKWRETDDSLEKALGKARTKNFEAEQSKGKAKLKNVNRLLAKMRKVNRDIRRLATQRYLVGLSGTDEVPSGKPRSDRSNQ